MYKNSLSNLRNELNYEVFNFISPSVRKRFTLLTRNKALQKLSQSFSKRIREIELLNIVLNLQLHNICSKNLIEFSSFLYYDNIVSLTLDFNCNYIDDTGVYYLCEALTCINNLYQLKLNFNSNRLTTLGVGYISTVLKKFISLEVFYLDLSCNDVTPEGAHLISSALSRLKFLTFLSLILQFSQIEDEGVRYLVESIKGLDNLNSLSLYLSVNRIKEYEILIDLISSLSKLRYMKLDLYNNLIEIFSSKLLDIFKMNTIKKLNVNLGKNMITRVPEKDLKKLVMSDRELLLFGNPIITEDIVSV